MTLRRIAVTGMVVVLAGLGASAQNPPPQNPPAQNPPPQNPPPVQRPQRANQARIGAGVPAGQMSPQQVQELVDGWALVESQRVLQLTDDQVSTFVPRYMDLQRQRRRLHMERQRLMREMQPLLQSTESTRDEAIVDKLRLLDELGQRTFQELRKAQMNIDAVLAPVQRARFRTFEERLELRKLEMLNSVGRGRGANPPGNPPAPGTGRKGGI